MYTKLITNNHTSLNLWSKENLVKHQNVSKYNDYDSLQNFLSLLMSFSAVPVVKDIQILTAVYFIFF